MNNFQRSTGIPGAPLASSCRPRLIPFADNQYARKFDRPAASM